MFIPILFVVGFALYGLKLGNKLQSSDFRVGAAAAAPRLPQPSYVGLLNARLAKNLPVSDWLVCQATREAFDRGDWATVKLLADFGDPDPAPASQEPAKEEPKTEGDDESPQKPAAPDTSPLDGVELDDWSEFVQHLATRQTGFKEGRLAGKYEQNVGRLRQLGLDVPQGDEAEYKALVADMSDYWDSEAKLIRESAGEVVELSGEQHPVTPSGILGLLKAAGPQGARSWLSNEADRTRFPHTTEIFLRTNGCF